MTDAPRPPSEPLDLAAIEQELHYLVHVGIRQPYGIVGKFLTEQVPALITRIRAFEEENAVLKVSKQSRIQPDQNGTVTCAEIERVQIGETFTAALVWAEVKGRDEFWVELTDTTDGCTMTLNLAEVEQVVAFMRENTDA
jgi:hypothetical protein